jgi:hypothetical protein
MADAAARYRILIKTSPHFQVRVSHLAIGDRHENGWSIGFGPIAMNAQIVEISLAVFEGKNS